MSNSESSIPKWYCLELPRTEYEAAHGLQRGIAAARHAGVIDHDVAMVLEHPPVFTLGRRGGMDNLTVSPNALRERGISVIQAERGGDVTYHGPGQLIVYLIVHLDRMGLGVTEFVTYMEELMIRTAADQGIVAERNPVNRGVWVAGSKLGSIGITVRKGVTFHGLALNVDMDLTPFDWINPCGLRGVRMTSLAKETGGAVDGKEIRKSMKHHLEKVFKIELVARTKSDIDRLLKPSGG